MTLIVWQLLPLAAKLQVYHSVPSWLCIPTFQFLTVRVEGPLGDLRVCLH